MNTTQTQKGNDSPLAFKCGYCTFMRVTEGSQVLAFEDGNQRVCAHCVKATEYVRSRLPIVEGVEY